MTAIAADLGFCSKLAFTTTATTTEHSYCFLSELIYELHQLLPQSQVSEYYQVGIIMIGVFAAVGLHLLDYYLLGCHPRIEILAVYAIENTSV